MRYLIVLCLAGCVSLRPAHRNSSLVAASSPERCNSLATKSEVEHILAILFGGIGSGAGAIAPALQSNTIAQDCVLGVGGAFGLAGAVLSYTAGVAAANYTKECP